MTPEVAGLGYFKGGHRQDDIRFNPMSTLPKGRGQAGCQWMVRASTSAKAQSHKRNVR